MMGFMETMVLMPYSLVSLHTNFIITSGPMAMTSSHWLPSLIRASSAFVTRPFSPQLPSSDIFTTRFETASVSYTHLSGGFSSGSFGGGGGGAW